MRGKLSPAILNREKRSASTFPRTNGSADRSGLLLEEAVAFASAEHGDFFQLSTDRSSCARPISTGAPTWAITCGD